MSKKFQKEYLISGGKVAHVRKKENGSYEIRYRRDGINISVSSKDIGTAKEKFIKKFTEVTTRGQRQNALFVEYSKQWLEVVKKPQIKDVTYQAYQRSLENYVYGSFGQKMVREIRPLDVQRVINELTERGLYRSAGHIYVVLKALFDFAVAEDVILKSPMALIKKPRYEVNHGRALTASEEREFIKTLTAGTSRYKYAFLLMLFTGIRRSELATVEISGPWVIVVTSKTRKGMEAKVRKIPISPMLEPFIPFMSKENLNISVEKLTKKITNFLPGHHLHDLRHTFITRCQECGVSRELTSLWAGHQADTSMTSLVYTHFSEEYQLKEIKKLRY